MTCYQFRAPPQRGRTPYVQMLRPKQVAELASSICERLGFGACDPNLILSRMARSLPTIMERQGRELWIDRYYIALDDEDSRETRYLYLTRRHVEESLDDHRRLLRRGRAPVLDPETLQFFPSALTRMRYLRRAYLLSLGEGTKPPGNRTAIQERPPL